MDPGKQSTALAGCKDTMTFGCEGKPKDTVVQCLPLGFGPMIGDTPYLIATKGSSS